MYQTYPILTSLGEKLRSLLQEHGDFKSVEIQLSRWSKRVQSDDKKGRWVTKQYLMDEEKYTKTFECNRINSFKISKDKIYILLGWVKL